jgi:proton-dependent oligopeptide transporter, POT family
MSQIPATDPTQGPQVFGHPRGLMTLFFTEMWERFTYYGMRALLVLFLADAVRGGFGLSDVTATAIYGLYISASYIFCLPGGWIADRLIGARRAVWHGGVLIALGNLLLAVGAHNQSSAAFYGGLVVVVCGVGLLKPNISAMVADLYPEGGARRDAGFTIFYMGINLGGFLGPLVTGWLGLQYGWGPAFLAGAVLMTLGLVQYKIFQRNLGHAGLAISAAHGAANETSKHRGWMAVGSLAAGIVLAYVLVATGALDINPLGLAQFTGATLVAVAVGYFSYMFFFAGLERVEKRRMGVILFLFIGCALFWAGFEQTGASLNLFADRYVDRSLAPITFGGLGAALDEIPWAAAGIVFVVLFAAWMWVLQTDFRAQRRALQALSIATLVLILFMVVKWLATATEVPTEWFQSLNSIYILIFAAPFSMLWVWLAKRNLDPSAPGKFGIALILLGLGFVFMVIAANVVSQGGKAMPYLLALTYLLHTYGELCLSPVGLSFVTKLAPARYVSQMMGVWFLATSVGNLSAGLLAGMFETDNVAAMPGQYMNFVYFICGAGIVLWLLSRPVKNLMGGVK